MGKASHVINFLVLWSICLSISFAQFKKGPEYLTRETSQVFIRLIRFLYQSLDSRKFLLLRFFFLNFFLHLRLLDGIWSYSQVFLIFFSRCSSAFLIWQFYSFFFSFFPFSIKRIELFFNSKFHSYNIRGAFNKFPDFFEQAFKIVVNSWKFRMLLLYILLEVQMNSYSSKWNTPY